MGTTAPDQTTFNNEMRGALFPNDKGDNPKRPDYRGVVTVNGTEYRLAGWKRRSKKGTPYLSLSVTVAPDPDPGAATDGDDADEIPF